MREYVKPILVVLWLLLSGCSSAPQIPFTPEQVQGLTDVKQLEDLHISLSTQLAGQDAQKYAAEFSLLNNINQRLSELHQKRLEGVLDAKRIRSSDFAEGVVPLPDLAQIKQELTQAVTSTPSLMPLVSAPVNREE